MLVKFRDDMFMQGAIPYDEISIREDHTGNGIIRCKNGEVILTSMTYNQLLEVYESAIKNDISLMFEHEDEEEDDEPI